MRRPLFVLALLIVVVPVLAAQTKPAAAGAGTVNTSWKCAPPNPVNMIPVADQPNHAFGVEQITCTATKGEVAGVKEKDGVATEFLEATGTNAKGHGIFIATLASGDKVTYSYTFTGTSTADNKFVSGANTWTITGGTGKMKGISGKGTCKGKGNPDGGASFDCTGTYATK